MRSRVIHAALLALLLTPPPAPSQLKQYKAVDPPQPGENIAQPCQYEVSFPAAQVPVKAAWVIYDRGPDITSFYTDPGVIAFASKNSIAMVLAHQCPASRTAEEGEMDMNPGNGLGRSLFSALANLGSESGHPELAKAKLILLGFSGTGAYFGHFVAYSPDRVLASILANPGQTDPDNVDKITLDTNGIAVPELIVAGGHDAIAGVTKPYAFYDHHRTHHAPWIFLVQNNIPHCCINNIRPFLLDWLQAVIDARKPSPNRPLRPMNQIAGWYGSIQPCPTQYQDHWGLPLWNVCDAHISRNRTAFPPNEKPAAFFPTQALAQEWLAYIKQPNHPKTSFSRPDHPEFGEPKPVK
ncbi:hypothetical protein SAMN05421771_3174 [Granulicella pectinivorans]|uniref:Dienelactone hydrolase n=1 Tax=Granulicella pectinivorans TaxID=474950 RepID=A0A1I6MPC3_9BACT|nr:hypothetical protein [Granulicella pectinivorans]SFS17494.1 hypothetical protein SAMN05421771_3174 [Granulicella pectinivorans]